MSVSGNDDDALLARAAQGDGEAFALFYRRHLGTVVGYLLRRTGDREASADLAAEVFATALASASRFKPGGAPALAWLFGIAANKLRESARRGQVEDAARRRLAWEPVALDDDDLAAVDALAGASDESSVVAAVAALAPEQRDAILARVVDECGYPEIAERMRCSESVVRQRVSRGLRTLRARIQEPR
jgi:RNA polymerase sigma-70 factor (ECF subfamily)